MRENGATDPSLCAPTELLSNRGMTDQGTVSVAHQRAKDSCAVAHVDIHPTKCASRIRQLGDIGCIEKRARLSGYSVSDGRRAYRVLNGNRLEFDPTYICGLEHEYPAAFNRVATNQIEYSLGRVNRTRSTF